MVSTRSDKWFDITYTLKRFNANESLTFKDIAEEYGMSEEEFEDRLSTMAGDDEKDRVKRAKSTNKRRERRRAARMVKEETTTEENTMQESLQSSFIIKQSELIQEIEKTEEKLSESRANLEAMKVESERNQRIVANLQNEINRRVTSIQNMEKKIEHARTKLKKMTEKLKTAVNKAEDISQQIGLAKAQVYEEEEYLEVLHEELEGLDNFVINLIDPNYNLERGLPSIGRLISTVKFDGVDVEEVESDINQLTFSYVLSLSHMTGFSNVDEFKMAYDFAWLCMSYKIDSNYEIHVITQDQRINKLIDLLMA